MVEFLRQAVADKNETAEKFARASLNAGRIENMLALAECEIFIRPEQLDVDPYLLNFINGTVDLRTGTLRPALRSDYITKLVNYSYLSDAKCPRWLLFLEEIMGGGPDAGQEAQERAGRMVDYLQRSLGYSITGCTIEKAIFVLFGRGDNGKSTMLNTVRQLVEEYAVLLQADSLMVRQESNNTQADLADLRGARFAQTSETEEGQRLAQGKLKRITQGMGKIKAVRKYQNPIEFSETHKLWMDTNRKPAIKDADDGATFSRLHPVPFVVQIPRERIDRDLPAKLMSEAEGILAWFVAGAVLWAAEGLSRPPEVESARAAWHDEVDQLGQFISERCVIGEAFRVRTSQLYSAYHEWCQKSGEKHTTPSAAFRDKIENRNFQVKHTNSGDVYLTIGLRATTGGDE
jgi:putative DNA primase/helicase